MNKKTGLLLAVIGLTSVAGLGVGGYGAYLAFSNQAASDSKTSLGDANLKDVAGYTVVESDTVIELKPVSEGGNSQFVWHCGKVLFGTPHHYVGTWSNYGGVVAFDDKSGEIKAVELTFANDGITGEGVTPEADQEAAPGGLCNQLKPDAQAWFVEEHPKAVFKSTQVEAIGDQKLEGALEDCTHVITGMFQLNGVEKELQIGAKLTFGEKRAVIEARFSFNRTDFDVVPHPNISPPGLVVDEVVTIEAKIDASPGLQNVVAELASLLNQQATVSQELSTELATLRKDLIVARESLGRIDKLEAQVEIIKKGGASAPAVDVSKLPATFSDKVDYSNKGGLEGYRALEDVSFDMVLIKGDSAAEVEPFYVQATEVTWAMLYQWSYCNDIEDEVLAAELKEKKLRPSPCYDDATRGFGAEGRSALGVSYRNARIFAKWMAERTGRPYRLMSEAEWNYLAANSLGGKSLTDLGWFADNTDTDDFGEIMQMPVAKKPADAFGLYDLWGNVAEWVEGDKGCTIRGGSYYVDSSEVNAEWALSENQDVWNATYPQVPVSEWWYRDRYDQGFRLVCDPINLPE